MRTRRWLPLLLVALAAGLVSTLAAGGFGAGSAHEVGQRPVPVAESGHASAPELDGVPGRRSARGTRVPEGAGDGERLVVRPVRATEEPSVVPTDPRMPPSSDEGGVDGSAGGFGMSFGAGWERFPMEPPRGPARLLVRVEDSVGVPVPGAEVILGASEVLGRSPVSWERLRSLGKTGSDGTLSAEHLLEGRGVVTAEVSGLLLTAHGLDARPAVPIELRGTSLHTATVRLPFEAASLGSVEGLVRDGEGRAVVSARVSVGWNEVVTRADGRFRLSNIPSGPALLKADAAGHVAASVVVDIQRGATATAALLLAHEERGPLVLAGVVRDASGAAVPAARVFLGQDFLEGGGYTLRQVRSDEAGRFRFESLPERFQTHTAVVQVHVEGYPFFQREFAGGLPSSEVALELAVKQVKLVLLVLEAESGAPITSCLAEVFRPGEREPYTMISQRSAEGRYEAWVEHGTLELAVEAPDHEAEDVVVDVGAPGGTYSHTARLKATATEPSVEVDLTVIVLSAATGAPVTAASIAVLDASGIRLSTLERRSADGRYRLPAPSGARRLRVEAAGHTTVNRPVELLRSPRTQEVEVRLP